MEPLDKKKRLEEVRRMLEGDGSRLTRRRGVAYVTVGEELPLSGEATGASESFLKPGSCTTKPVATMRDYAG